MLHAHGLAVEQQRLGHRVQVLKLDVAKALRALGGAVADELHIDHGADLLKELAHVTVARAHHQL